MAKDESKPRRIIMRSLLCAACALVFLTLATAASAQIAFRPSYGTTGGDPVSVTTADLNGDGILDLAVANRKSDTISILLGVGDGSFPSRKDFPTASGPVAVAAGDFNGDNKLDLAVAHEGADTIAIYLGDGAGNFASPVASAAIGTRPTAVVVADVNGDGHLDVAVADRVSNSVAVFLGNGTGALGFRQDFPCGGGPTSVLAGDFNLDGHLDLATSDSSADTISILLGNGDGTFAAPVAYAAGLMPVSLAAADFNADQKLDLALANGGQSSISTLSGRGDGAFDPRVDLGTDTAPIAVFAGDLDGDGQPDLGSANIFYFSYWYIYSSISVRLNTGGGSFAPKRDLVVYGDPTSIAQGDFNADGKVDLAYVGPQGGATVYVLLQAPEIHVTPPVSFNRVAVFTSSPPQALTIHSTGSLPLRVDGLTITGQAADFLITNDGCSGNTIPVGSSCSVVLVFSPTCAGDRVANVSIQHNGVGSSSVQLFGVGENPPNATFALMPGPSGAQASIRAGQSATFDLSFVPQNSFTGMVTLLCAGVPALATCSFSPNSVTLDGLNPATARVTIATMGAGIITPPGLRVPSPGPGPLWLLPALLCLGAFWLVAVRKSARLKPSLAFCAVVLVVVLAAGCGGASSQPARPSQPPPPQTQPGTYSITVVANSGSIQKSVTLTLTVH
jgi:hypothetical protein